MGEWIDLKAADGHSFKAYKAVPAGTPLGKLVVIQEIFGVNDHIRSVCDDYAREGLVAVAPALFDRTEPGLELGYSADDVARGRAVRGKVSYDEALMDVAATLDHLGSPAAVIGYCWGGSVAWLAASRLGDRVAAVVAYYGGDVPKLADEEPRCPVQLHFGREDQAIPLDGVQALQARHPDLPVFLYPAGHGFNCDQRGSYHAESAKLARERSVAFLREQLAK